MNKQIQFWLTIGSFVTLLILFIFVLMNSFESITFQKEYCLFCLPSLIYLMWQFVVNYYELTKDNE